eukprot:SAG11_NODE_537_length_8672_cov_3.282632_2_plen_212_part_00
MGAVLFLFCLLFLRGGVARKFILCALLFCAGGAGQYPYTPEGLGRLEDKINELSTQEARAVAAQARAVAAEAESARLRVALAEEKVRCPVLFLCSLLRGGREGGGREGGGRAGGRRCVHGVVAVGSAAYSFRASHVGAWAAVRCLLLFFSFFCAKNRGSPAHFLFFSALGFAMLRTGPTGTFGFLRSARRSCAHKRRCCRRLLLSKRRSLR